MLRINRADFFIFPAFLTLTVLAYWQVAFLQNGLKWDMLGCYLPWRYHVGECLQNGIFPLWNPFTHGGYPIHADLRSVWYPETFIIGLTTGYSYLTLHLLFILHIALSGLGMYKLSQHFTGNRLVAFIAGAAYLMSGFMVGHGQEMFGIIAATWIPFVLYYFIRLQQERNFADVLRTTVFVFLLVTGGYQAMWAILFYLMLALFLTFLIRSLISGLKKEAWQLIKLNAALLFITVVSLAVILITFLQVSPEVGRLGGVTPEEAWFMPFSPRSAVSFLLPFATVKDSAWYDTDISMNNAYSGLIILVFFIAAVFSKKRFLLNVFLIFGLVALMASFGKYTPVRSILYHYVPMLDLFRHASFFVYFAVIAIIPAAASGLESFLSNPASFRKRLIVITGLVFFFLVALLVNALLNMGDQEFLFFRFSGDFATWLSLPGRNEHIVIQSVIQLLVLLLFLIAIAVKHRVNIWFLTFLICFEMFLSVQMNSFYTVVSAGINPFDLQHILRQRPEGFPIPVAGMPVSLNTEKNASSSVIWQNTNIYNKTVSFEGYNSFRLNGYESLADSFPGLAIAALNNEVIYLSDQVRPLHQMKPDDDLQKILHTGGDDVPAVFSDLRLSEDDTVIIRAFYPGYAEAEVISRNKVAVTLLQGWYPGWEACVDGKESPLFVTNMMFLSTPCQPGKHVVRFRYSNMPVMAGFIVSYAMLLILVSALICIRFRDRSLRVRIALVSFLWLSVLLLWLFRFNPAWSGEASKDKVYRIAAEEIVKAGVEAVICNADDGTRMSDALKGAAFKGRYYMHNLTYQKGLSDLLSCLDTLDAGKVALLSLYAPLPDAAGGAVRVRWPGLITDRDLTGGSLMIFGESDDVNGFTSVNDFEKPEAGWSGNPASLDSTRRTHGRFSNRIDSLNHGSYSFRWAPLPHQAGKPFEVFVRSRVTGDFTGASLFIQLLRNGSQVRSLAVSSGSWQVTTGKWSNVAAYGDFPDGAGDGEEVRVFFWGNGRSTFYLDNFQVTVRFTGGK